MFEVSFLPARYGDAIWIEYGNGGSTQRILIDGGTRGTRSHIRRLLAGVSPGRSHLELLVVTHVDRDHIEGVLGLLQEADSSLRIDDVWFNGWRHLPPEIDVEAFGPAQGESLTRRILELELPWNGAFDGGPIVIPDAGALPTIDLPGGMRLTLLSPTHDALAKLKPVWEREVIEAGLVPGQGEDVDDDASTDEAFGAADLPDIDALAATPFDDDRSAANRSSIAFIAEFEGKRVLFGADAHVAGVEAALDRLPGNQRPRLDLYKISHHGSKNTTSRPLVERVDCSRFVFSTNGSLFKHPHGEAVSRVIKGAGEGAELIFNYKSPRNEVWDLTTLKRRHGYRTRYPDTEENGVTIQL